MAAPSPSPSRPCTPSKAVRGPVTPSRAPFIPPACHPSYHPCATRVLCFPCFPLRGMYHMLDLIHSAVCVVVVVVVVVWWRRLLLFWWWCVVFVVCVWCVCVVCVLGEGLRGG